MIDGANNATVGLRQAGGRVHRDDIVHEGNLSCRPAGGGFRTRDRESRSVLRPAVQLSHEFIHWAENHIGPGDHLAAGYLECECLAVDRDLVQLAGPWFSLLGSLAQSRIRRSPE